MDFGRGFYTTGSFEQAERWSNIKAKRLRSEVAYVTVYEFDLEYAMQNLNIKTFDEADEEWLSFVAANIRGVDFESPYDIYKGPVANDNVYQTIKLYKSGAYDAEQTIKCLKTEVLFDQWTFSTEGSLQYLHYADYVKIR